jgi:hypothetical protein
VEIESTLGVIDDPTDDEPSFAGTSRWVVRAYDYGEPFSIELPPGVETPTPTPTPEDCGELTTRLLTFGSPRPLLFDTWDSVMEVLHSRLRVVAPGVDAERISDSELQVRLPARTLTSSRWNRS